MTSVLKTLGIHPAETAMAGWVALVFAMVQTTHGFAANAGDALFFRRFGVENLPPFFIVLGIVSAGGMLLYGGALNRYRRGRLLAGVLVGSGILYIVEWALIPLDPPGLYPAIWVTVSFVILITFTVMWNVAGEVSDARQAKRLFPLYASAGILGGIVGNLATGPLASAFGTENLLPLSGVILVLSAFPLLKTSRYYPRLKPTPSSISSDVRAGWDVVRGLRLLMLMAAAIVLLRLLFYSAAFPFSEQVTAEFPDEAALARYLGLFSGVATALSFVVSLFLAGRIYSRLGIVWATAILPIVYIAGFGLWLGRFDLLTATLHRGAQWVALNAVSGSSFNALFNVVPAAKRPQAMSFIVGVPAQIGVVLSGVWLIAAQQLLEDTGEFAVSLAMAVLALVIVLAMRPAYTDALITGLRGGLVGLFRPEASEGLAQFGASGEVRVVLADALQSSDVTERRIAVSMLARIDAGDLLAPAIDDKDPTVRAIAAGAMPDAVLSQSDWRRLLADEAPGVRRAAVERLDIDDPDSRLALQEAGRDSEPDVMGAAAARIAAVAPDVAETAARALLESADPAARIAGVAAASACSALFGEVVAATSDPDSRVRQAAVEAVEPEEHWRVLVPMLGDSSPAVRRAAAMRLRGVAAATDEILARLDDRLSTREAALYALRGSGVPELSHWAAERITRANRLRRWRAGVHTQTGPVADLLVETLQRREWAAERHAVLASDGTTDTGSDLVLRGLRSGDPDLRAEALEAIEAATIGRIGRDVVRLIETEQVRQNVDLDGVLAEMAEDADPWIRALSAAFVIEMIQNRSREVVERVGRDNADLVRELVPLELMEKPMPERVQTMSEMDCIVALRRVALFDDLDLDDLRALVQIADERVYEPDELIFRDGDEGNEMLIIVDGSVSISKEHDGVSEEIRQYQSGEVVGELAVLRDNRRAADVYAVGAVRALAVDGASFQGMLHERPEMALAMLSTLAERLGTTV